MDERVAQLAYSTRLLSYPQYATSLHLDYKECYIIHSGQHAVDYTGLRIWPGAHLLAYYLLHVQHAQRALEGQVVCELGAGVGLCGLLAARYARHVVATDRVQAVLDVIDRNIAANQLSSVTASSHLLEWGSSGARELLKHRSPITVVVAADVIYPDTTDDSMHALFDTVTALLSSSSSSLSSVATTGSSTATAPASSISSSPLHGRFVLSYVNRSAATCRRFLRIAHSHHYVATHVPQPTYLVDREQHQTMETELQQLRGYILVMERVEETEQQDVEEGDSNWLQVEPFVSMMASESSARGQSEQQQQQQQVGISDAADDSELSVLPLGGYEEDDAEVAMDLPE